MFLDSTTSAIRLRVDEIILVELYQGLRQLGWNQPDIVPLRCSTRPTRWAPEDASKPISELCMFAV
jgi:hypothetical protein